VLVDLVAQAEVELGKSTVMVLVEEAVVVVVVVVEEEEDVPFLQILVRSFLIALLLDTMFNAYLVPIDVHRLQVVP
jgi:hypothetical protein